MAQDFGRRATYADLEAVPSNLVAEILDGVLVTHPRPLPRHGLAHVSLASELAGPFQKGRDGGPGGWVFMTEPELHLGDQVVVPDLAAWRRERMPYLIEEVGIPVPPDWACEVISPSTARYDRSIKYRIYYEQGVAFLWHLDPQAKTLEAFKRGPEHWHLTGAFGEADDVCAEPFEAIAFPMSNLFPLDSPPASKS